MLLRPKHAFGFMFLVAVYAPTETSELEEKEMFYAKLDSIVDQYPSRNVLVVLGDFNTVIGTERVDYELFVGAHGSGNRNVNSSFPLNFAVFRRLRIGDS